MTSKTNIVLLSTTIISVFSINMLVSMSNAIAAENSCVSYNSKENEISISCKYANFIDIEDELQNQTILYREFTNTTNSFNEKNWILNAGIRVEKDAILNIDSDDVTWLKIIPSKNTSNAIEVDGSLKVDSVKITSWNPETDDYVKFPKDAKYEDAVSAEEIYTSVLRPYIKVNTDATGPTIIQNSELAYLGDCSLKIDNGCSGATGGVTFNGGKYSILKNNDIHHIFKGFYSKGMGYMLIEGNRVYENEIYGIDPHTGTHDMIIKDNIVYNNGHIGIICSLDCYNIIIEGNEVYNHPSTGIMFSRNMYDSIARNNYVHDEKKCIFVSDSHNNEIYNNTVSNCDTGILIHNFAKENKVYNNNIIKPEKGINVKTGASSNQFYSNNIVDAEEIPISIKKKDKTNNNIFEKNSIIEGAAFVD